MATQDTKSNLTQLQIILKKFYSHASILQHSIIYVFRIKYIFLNSKQSTQTSKLFISLYSVIKGPTNWAKLEHFGKLIKYINTLSTNFYRFMIFLYVFKVTEVLLLQCSMNFLEFYSILGLLKIQIRIISASCFLNSEVP